MSDPSTSREAALAAVLSRREAGRARPVPLRAAGAVAGLLLLLASVPLVHALG